MFEKSRKEKELIDREVEIYRKERFLEVAKAIEDYRATKNAQMVDIATKCANQIGEYEHTFHQTKETKGIELAKLEAQKESLEEILALKKKVVEETIAAYGKLMAQKDAEIKRLNEIVNLLINKQPTTTIQQLK